MPQSLREELQTLDPAIVKAAIERARQAATSLPESQRSSCSPTCDAFGKGTCAACERRAATDMAEVRRKLDGLIERDAAARAEELAFRRLAALRAEHWAA